MEIVSNSADQTQKLGQELAARLRPGVPVCLYGDLGAGKTVLVQGLARGLGITETLTSPTFVVIRQYKLIKPPLKHFYHIDLYRVRQSFEIKTLGLKEILVDQRGIVAIEWPERLETTLPNKRLDIRIDHLQGDKRKITIWRQR